jgi:acyl-coenzyme A synthetase/AMP-(fatty) acid ligase
MLGFIAACLREQTNLLPASQASGAIAMLRNEYADSHVIDDEAIASSLPTKQPDTHVFPSIRSDHVAAICFTSGSTGHPQPRLNTWSVLVASARRSAAGIFTQPSLQLVGTVPPQHMFGLETTIFQPLVNSCVIHNGRPFFPADVRDALARTPEPRVLITTPAHLRACIAAELQMPTIEFVLSATAPLAIDLATQIESSWRTRVLEIYGSTETGAIATRQTTAGPTWRLLPGGAFESNDESTRYRPANSNLATELHDAIDRIDATRFVLAGRNTDLIKIAGKRASLAELNARLLAIPGVQDGVIFQPTVDDRVAALVVADHVSEREILQALSAHLDEVFLPRPVRIVAALPRDALGKLPHAQLLAALKHS